ncbi:tetratricopeptide repeat protein [Sphingobium subterraneum]|uniref:Ancillary SecYEG translocon subunit/Cell division coordinator CpoB TPR domain-containing protein n=1 Tax=Sphingobium subterraneum TaxID=627688 RepID=A0A841J8D7_9SPHN|nr:tetratricopeptide repeat protein [Sphingobium subterraneum]MBB6124818.1 hypothetical protein [Sphingobium subterraneum]
MALTPSTDEAFLREVDEAVRQDQLRTAWQRYGLMIVGAIVAGLVLFGGTLYWRQHTQQESGKVAEQAGDVVDVVVRGGTPDPKALAALEKADQPGYRAAAALLKAADTAKKGDRKAAAALYGQMAADTKLAQPYRDLALVRQVALNFDTMTPQQVVDTLKPLAVAGEPWFGSAGEMTAIAYMKMRKPDLAGPIFAAIAKDEQVPQTLRGRARQMAGLLGVDAVAPQE